MFLEADTMPVLCDLCTEKAILKRPKSGRKLCKECFYFVFEEEIHRTIMDAELFTSGESVAIGASGKINTETTNSGSLYCIIIYYFCVELDISTCITGKAQVIECMTFNLSYMSKLQQSSSRCSTGSVSIKVHVHPPLLLSQKVTDFT